MTTKKKAKYILEDLLISEVSLVSKPAIGKTFLLLKSADEVAAMVTDTPDHLFTDQDLEAYIAINLA